MLQGKDEDKSFQSPATVLPISTLNILRPNISSLLYPRWLTPPFSLCKFTLLSVICFWPSQNSRDWCYLVLMETAVRKETIRGRVSRLDTEDAPGLDIWSCQSNMNSLTSSVNKLKTRQLQLVAIKKRNDLNRVWSSSEAPPIRAQTEGSLSPAACKSRLGVEVGGMLGETSSKTDGWARDWEPSVSIGC